MFSGGASGGPALAFKFAIATQHLGVPLTPRYNTLFAMRNVLNPQNTIDINAVNTALDGKDAADVIKWAHDQFNDQLAMTTSFGVQAAVMLHLVTQIVPHIPIIFIDTGFHFPETYRFADDLTKRLNLNLKVYQSNISPARMVAIHGQLWEQDGDGIDNYNKIRKVEPMQRALSELNVKAWLAGLRKSQTDYRASLRFVEPQNDTTKVHPILNWTTKDVHDYLKRHDLPFHPLHEKGYASIGDWHSTSPIGESQNERDGRFKGLKQECGLHLPQSQEEDQSLESSGL
jgi:phosphoadenosine phosphosulfate reductase